MPTKISQLRTQVRSLQKQLQRFQKYFQKGSFSYQQQRFIQCCQFFDRLSDSDLTSWPPHYFCRECRKRLRPSLRKKRGMKKLPFLSEKIKNIPNITNYVKWLQEKNLSPHTIRYYLTTLAKFPGEITTDKLRNYFRQNINQYDPTSLHVQKNALHSYIKFQKLPIDWEKLARIIPSSQRKYFATIDEQDLTKLKTAKVEKNPRIYERNNLLLDFCFIVVCGLTN